jgi:very-short-patch-repair endonuclease
MKASDALLHLGGIADPSTLLRLTTRKRLRTALASGDIVRVGHGRLALPVADRGLLAAQEANGYLSHLSAAGHWGWEVGLPPDRPQITLHRKQPRPAETSTPIELFQRDLPSSERAGWATTPLATVIDCARDLPFRDALAVADSALRHGQVAREQLVTATAKLRGARGRRARWVAKHASPRADTAFESMLRAIAIEVGLQCIPQHEIWVNDLALHPDLADPFRGVVLEADSWAHHASKDAHDRDCVRYNSFISAGWAVLRFTWPQVVFAPSYVQGVIHALLAELGSKGAFVGPPWPHSARDTPTAPACRPT